MKKIKIWWISAAFFVVCCVLNLIGCITSGDLERCVKPALMLLLCLTTVAYLSGAASSKEALLLVCGQLFGFAGDTMLMGKGFPYFAGGIGLFLIGHLFYISFFAGRSWKGLKLWQWALGLSCCAAFACAIIFLIGIKGVMLAPMGIYGLVLTLLMFSTLAGALRFGGLSWWILFAGSVLFSFSDALIAVRNFGTLSPFVSGFVVMFTYLAAQTLLAIGGTRLITTK